MKKKPYNGYLRYSNMGFQILAAIVLGAWLGKQLDNYLANKIPYCAGFGALIGTGAGLYVALKDIINPPKNEEEDSTDK